MGVALVAMFTAIPQGDWLNQLRVTVFAEFRHPGTLHLLR